MATGRTRWPDLGREARRESGILDRLRPPRPDIAAPPWPPGLEWAAAPAPPMERLTASGPVLVHFFDFAQLNSLRALPYLLAWRDRYREHGLRTVGVHSPRFGFTQSAEAVASGTGRLGIEHPVALDPDYRLWRDYGCKGWPSLFLWGRGGALRWYHLGEGEYAETELALREAIEEAELGAGEWPAPLEPLRPSDEPGARVVVPTPELFPGGSPQQPWRPSPGEPSLSVEYAAQGAFASVDGSGSLSVAVDGATPRRLELAPGLVELDAHDRHGEHSLTLEASEGVSVYSISFAPGVP